MAAAAGRHRCRHCRCRRFLPPCVSGWSSWPPIRARRAGTVKKIEKRINHDVKAVEYFVRDELKAGAPRPRSSSWCISAAPPRTSTTSAMHGCCARPRSEQLLPAHRCAARGLRAIAQRHAALPMLSRTHGQTATPTTLGKEFANVRARLHARAQRLAAVEILGKWNGAVGNFNAHRGRVPGGRLARASPAASSSAAGSRGIRTPRRSSRTTGSREYCDALAAINVIGIDMCRDIWGYVSLGYLRQRPVEGEVGSSTMPHKINPIDFENAEGNLGVANALLRHFSEKLPVSRWQRDLTDSTVLRNVGVALGPCLIAWRAALRGLGKIAPDAAAPGGGPGRRLGSAGRGRADRVARRGRADGYELLKEYTRGQAADRERWPSFIAALPLPEAERKRLLALTPADYVGLAATLAARPDIAVPSARRQPGRPVAIWRRCGPPRDETQSAISRRRVITPPKRDRLDVERPARCAEHRRDCTDVRRAPMVGGTWKAQGNSHWVSRSQAEQPAPRPMLWRRRRGRCPRSR